MYENTEQLTQSTVRSAPPTLTRRKAIGFALVAVSLGVFASLIVGEILYRAVGYKPWMNFADADRPAICEPNGVLGWRNKPGVYVFPTNTPGGPPIEVTIMADGRRATGPEILPGRPIVAVMGCSVTHGWGLTDRETYPWRLQVRNPGVEIRNYGTPGYGTYQSLLTLERVFADARRPAMVLYGLLGDHEIRNVAGAGFLMELAIHSSRGHFEMPYCSIGPDGLLQRNPAAFYADFPLRDYSAIANRLQRGYMKFTARPREAQKREVTERLLDEMDVLCRRNGADFAVIMLLASEEARSHYLAYCAGRGIACYDCVYPLTRDRMIPGDGHPNGALNELWADRIEEQIRTKLVSLSHPPE